jgi:L-fuculose-phosphate aldolase
MDILKLSHSISKFTIGFEGNVSKKVNDTFLIKASGTSLSTLSEQQLILCSLANCEQLSNFEKKPSLEVSFHSELLKEKNVNFVAHTHPINTLKILCSEHLKEFAENRLFPDQVVFNKEKSCIVEYANPGIELTKKILISIKNFKNANGYLPNLLLLKNHGIITIASNYEECIISTEICEKSAEIFIGAKQLNSIKYLSSDDINKLKNDKNEKYRIERMNNDINIS